MEIEWFRWIFTVLIAPALGFLGGLFAAGLRAKRRKNARMLFLSGLPMEHKAVLMEFYLERTHTLRLDPSTHTIQLLVRHQILDLGTGGGTYDAVDRYATITLEWWELVNVWAKRDPLARAMTKRALKELTRKDRPDQTELLDE